MKKLPITSFYLSLISPYSLCHPCVAVYTLARVFGVEGELSGIARQGSGSACRSIYGGFVQWLMGQQDDGKDSLAQQVAPETYWPELRILVLVVCLIMCMRARLQNENERIIMSCHIVLYCKSHVLLFLLRDYIKDYCIKCTLDMLPPRPVLSESQ